jgi:hypothetical protein
MVDGVDGKTTMFHTQMGQSTIPKCEPRCWFLLTYRTGWFWTRVNVGVHIPAPWSIWDTFFGF